MKRIAQTWPQQLLLTTLLLCTSAKLIGADFAQWRGPLRDGHSPESHLLQDWPKNGPKLLWQVGNIGAGYSTPAVVGENIYLISNEGTEERVVALAAMAPSATSRWRHCRPRLVWGASIVFFLLAFLRVFRALFFYSERK